MGAERGSTEGWLRVGGAEGGGDGRDEVVETVVVADAVLVDVVPKRKSEWLRGG